MDLSQRKEICQLLIYFFGKFVPVLEPLKKSQIDVPTNQMPIFVFFVSAGV